MVRREQVRDVTVVIEARPVGGLGWTWSFYPESGEAGSNKGKLLLTEEKAYAAALAEARRTLGDPPLRSGFGLPA